MISLKVGEAQRLKMENLLGRGVRSRFLHQVRLMRFNDK
jgi:hypothetical protein